MFEGLLGGTAIVQRANLCRVAKGERSADAPVEHHGLGKVADGEDWGYQSEGGHPGRIAMGCETSPRFQTDLLGAICYGEVTER